MDRELNELLARPENREKLARIVIEEEKPITLKQRLNLWDDMKLKLLAEQCTYIYADFESFLERDEKSLTGVSVAEQLALMFMLERIRFWKNEMYKAMDTNKPKLVRFKYEDAYTFHKVLSIESHAKPGYPLYSIFCKIHEAIVNHLPAYVSENVTQLTLNAKKMTTTDTTKNPQFAVFQGCIVVQLLEETEQKQGITYRKCAYLTAHKANLVTRNTKISPLQQQQHIKLFEVENLSYSMFQVIDMYRIWAR